MKRWLQSLVLIAGIAVVLPACSDEISLSTASEQSSIPDTAEQDSTMNPPDMTLNASMWVAFPVRGENPNDWNGVTGTRTDGGIIDACNKQDISSHSGADHYARDLSRKDGSTLNRRVHAGIDGEVVKAGWTDDYGKQVVIYDSARRVAVRYAHLNTYYVGIGARVKVNDMIGRMGNTGCQGGCSEHLHIVAYENVPDRNSIPYLCNSTWYACRIDFYYP